jgi:precorrin isomerase
MLTCKLAKLRSCLVPAALVCIGVGVTIGNAPAVTVEVAKKWAALTAKAFPPRVVGNPAAGFVNKNWTVATKLL